MAPKKKATKPKALKPKIKVIKVQRATRHVPKRIIAKVNRKRPASSFEKALHTMLREEGIKFVTEKTIGRLHVDILVGEKDIIEAQGCYWHGHPGCQKTLSDSQLTAQSSDARRFAFLKRLGYRVHDIWECEFNKDPEIFRAYLRKHLL